MVTVNWLYKGGGGGLYIGGINIQSKGEMGNEFELNYAQFMNFIS